MVSMVSAQCGTFIHGNHPCQGDALANGFCEKHQTKCNYRAETSIFKVSGKLQRKCSAVVLDGSGFCSPEHKQMHRGNAAPDADDAARGLFDLPHHYPPQPDADVATPDADVADMGKKPKRERKVQFAGLTVSPETAAKGDEMRGRLGLSRKDLLEYCLIDKMVQML